MPPKFHRRGDFPVKKWDRIPECDRRYYDYTPGADDGRPDHPGSGEIKEDFAIAWIDHWDAVRSAFPCIESCSGRGFGPLGMRRERPASICVAVVVATGTHRLMQERVRIAVMDFPLAKYKRCWSDREPVCVFDDLRQVSLG